ncbi:MAG TPA: Crp/Fnr family transcriptional regulator [Xanthobacteraceae bacterium]|nr:Crp/Fnr family transcriptional regulator [Xanthobacteraceae bacterium]
MAETHRGALDEARRLLGNCGLFRGLKIDERSAIINRARIRNVAAGERVFSIGAPGDYMAAVLAGTIRITVPSPHGRELLLAMLEAGELFGEMALLDGKERSADATANTSSILAILDRHEVLSFLERHPEVWPRIVEILCDRIRHTDIQLAEVALLRLPARLAKAILRMASNDPNPAIDNRHFRVQLTQQDLANLVGATRESVNKCLATWQRQGLVHIDGGQITVTDRPRLESLVRLI